MRRKHASAAILVSLLFTLASCKDQGPKIPSMTGQWSASLIDGTSISLTLSESNQVITGTGRFEGPMSMVVNVSGTHTPPYVAMTLTSQGGPTLTFQGSFGDTQDAVTGSLDGVGFGESIILKKR